MKILRTLLVGLVALLTPAVALADGHRFHGGEGFHGWYHGHGDRDGWRGHGWHHWDDHPYRGWGWRHGWRYYGGWAPAGYVSYCASVGVYYPQVTYCPGGWQFVVRSG
jgi:hypothetical protein